MACSRDTDESGTTTSLVPERPTVRRPSRGSGIDRTPSFRQTRRLKLSSLDPSRLSGAGGGSVSFIVQRSLHGTCTLCPLSRSRTMRQRGQHGHAMVAVGASARRCSSRGPETFRRACPVWTLLPHAAALVAQVG